VLQRPNPLDHTTSFFARTSGWSLVVLLALYLLPGTLQRGPWKNEDAMWFGVVWRALQNQEWLHFHLSASSLPESPLYYWVAAACGKLLQGILDVPAAIRVATTLFVSLGFGALYLTARRLFDRPWAGFAPLTLAGCLGLLIASHDVQPMTATLAALSVLLYGLSLVRPTAHVPAAPIALGISVIALGFGGLLLASGLRLLPPAVALVLVSVLLEKRRQHVIAIFLGVALGCGLFAGWWWQLQEHSPALSAGWLDYQFSLLTPQADTGKRLWINLTTLSWWAWPAWPLAGYAIWSHRNRLRSPALLGPVVLVVGIFFTLSLAGESRPVWLATLLPPLALLAVPAMMALRRGAESLLDWFGRMTFGLLLLVLAFGWSAITLGWPEKWASKSARMAPGFVGSFDPWAVGFAVLMVAGWLWTLTRSRRSPQRSLFAWSGGLITFWAVIVALGLPWFDHQRSYKGVAQQIGTAIGDRSACVRVERITEAQFASLDYYLPGQLRRNTSDKSACGFLITQAVRDGKMPLDGHWKPVWEGSRPGDKGERLQLFRRK